MNTEMENVIVRAGVAAHIEHARVLGYAFIDLCVQLETEMRSEANTMLAKLVHDKSNDCETAVESYLAKFNAMKNCLNTIRMIYTTECEVENKLFEERYGSSAVAIAKQSIEALNETIIETHQKRTQIIKKKRYILEKMCERLIRTKSTK